MLLIKEKTIGSEMSVAHEWTVGKKIFRLDGELMNKVDSIIAWGDELVFIQDLFNVGTRSNPLYTIPITRRNIDSHMSWSGDIAKTILLNLEV